jgi:hypothetical protein
MYCKTKTSVPDEYNERKKEAIADVERRGIKPAIYVLTSCMHAYTIDNVTVVKDRNTYKVYVCKELVFLMVNNYDLQKYICGAWADTLTAEARRIKAQHSAVKAADRAQHYKNLAAKKNYVVCPS